jgi:hypothetical protein
VKINLLLRKAETIKDPFLKKKFLSKSTAALEVKSKLTKR